MQRNFASSKKRDLARAVLLAMGAVSAASAHAQLVGGGATLPAVGYEGPVAALGGSTSERLANPATGDSGSLFGAVFTLGGPDVSYCQTGSGTGKRVLGGVLAGGPYAANNTCGNFSTTPLGFGGTNGKADPDFAASDAPMSQTEYSSVVNSWGTAHTAPVQFPVVAGAVGILYNNSAVSSLNLSDAQICRIFSGQITNWSQLGQASLALHVVYRTDGSGTSFSLSNHLSAVCAATGVLPAGEHFITDQTFSPNVIASIGALPSNFVGANGNPAVVATIAGSAGVGFIGYGEIADAQAHSPIIAHAKVNSLDPITDFAPTGTFGITTTTGQVISGVSSTGAPTLSAVTGGSQHQCVVIATPSAYANPSSGYPIVAVSNLLGYYSGNGTNAAAIQTLLSAPYDATTQSVVTEIGINQGLAWVSDSAGNANGTNVTACIN